MNTREYKNYKSLKKGNLRDNMTNLELVLNMLAETATTEISLKSEPKNLEENRKVAKEGSNIAGNARKQIEAKTGRRATSKYNFKLDQEQKKLKGDPNK